MDGVDGGVVEGYLLLADISGCTEFLTGTELEHSHAITALDDGRTRHRWLLRASDRTPEGLAAFHDVTSVFRELAREPWWGDQMRLPIAEDSALYGLGGSER